jgi:hypothetical protein
MLYRQVGIESILLRAVIAYDGPPFLARMAGSRSILLLLEHR